MNYFVKIKEYESEQIHTVDLCKAEDITVLPLIDYYKKPKHEGNRVVLFKFPNGKHNVLSEMSIDNVAVLEMFLATVSQNKCPKCSIDGKDILPELY
jgi:hypothetical protein